MIKEGVIISGRYEIMNRIGMGGMADVYKAIDRVLNRYVAVKVLKKEFREDATFVRKFRTEAQAAAGLTHPNIVNVYDVGEDRGLNYIVMELVEGITLKDYIQKKGPLSPKEVIGIALQVCAGIDAAHSKHIVHRDIKPQNIIISKEGKVKITDFGIAKATSSNTISTNAMGSVHYTSPEQARGGFSDAKSDIYSLGITMYEMITAELPFDGDSTVSVALKHLQEDITPPSELVDGIPYSLERIILKCTQKSPDRRYADVAALARDLKRSLADPNGDFVVISPLANTSSTVVITADELNQIKKASAYDENDYDYDGEDDDDDDEYEYDNRRRRSSNKKEIDPKMAKVMKILTIVVTVIFAFILLFVIGKATGILKFGPGVVEEQSDLYKAPNVVGMTVEEAEKECKSRGLELKVVKEVQSETYGEGIIDKQLTDEGAKLSEGAFLNVYVSTGLKGKEIAVPKILGETENDAKAALLEAGFKKANITILERESDEVEAGKVIGSTPDEGASVSEDAEITLIISTGSSKVMMPVLVNKTMEEAEALLKEKGLSGDPEEVFSNKAAGTVVRQEIESGTRIDKGTTVKYQVSKGQEPVTIPTGLVGKPVSTVKAALGNAGLVVTERFEESTKYAADTVIHVEGEGTQVPKGTTVTIVISTGSSETKPPESTEPTE